MGQENQDFKFVDGEAQVFELSIVVRNLEESMERFRTLFGWTPYIVREDPMPTHYVRGEKRKGGKTRYACYHAGPIRIEILEGVGDNVYTEFLEKRGVGVQHIGIRVSDHDSEVAELEKRGIGALQSMSVPQYNLKMSYLDTYDIAGVSFELVQSPGIPAEY